MKFKSDTETARAYEKRKIYRAESAVTAEKSPAAERTDADEGGVIWGSL